MKRGKSSINGGEESDKKGRGWRQGTERLTMKKGKMRKEKSERTKQADERYFRRGGGGKFLLVCENNTSNQKKRTKCLFIIV